MMDSSAKIVSLKQALVQRAAYAEAGELLVFTNGCFDLLHQGHVVLLEQARKPHGRLIVGLNSDASVRKLKGPRRPINPLADRARLLAALAAVDLVVSFDEPTPQTLIEALRPDVLVKGGDYDEKKIVGASFVKKIGGKVHIIPYIVGYSSSSYIKKIQSS